MRIISGKFKGRNLLDSSKLKDLRPTTNRNREALFNILSTKANFSLIEATILDVCAGSGAVSFEAISRGAKRAFLIENNYKHIELIKENAKLLKAEDKIKILNQDAKRLPKKPRNF